MGFLSYLVVKRSFNIGFQGPPTHVGVPIPISVNPKCCKTCLYTWNSQNKNPGWWFQTFFYFHPCLEKIPILTIFFFKLGWFNHQLEFSSTKKEVIDSKVFLKFGKKLGFLDTFSQFGCWNCLLRLPKLMTKKKCLHRIFQVLLLKSPY